MKKLINVLLLIVVCFVPLMVNAETELKYEWQVKNKDYISGVDGKYYLFNDDGKGFYIYDRNGSFIKNQDLDSFDEKNFDDIYKNKLVTDFAEFNDGTYLKYNSELDKYYSTNYYSGEFIVYGETIEDNSTILNFDENLLEIKELIGNEFNVADKVFSEDLLVGAILIENNYYIVYCTDEDFYYNRVYDQEANLIFESKFDYWFSGLVHVYDDKIYEIINTEFKIYDLNKELLYSKNLVDDLDEIYEDNYVYYFEYFDIVDNNLIVQYGYDIESPKGLNTVLNNRDIHDSTKERGPFFVAKFRLEFDVEAINSDNGGFIYERKIDEYDREYIEINVTPNKGYIIDKIIVTDVNGKEIEVTDNKFYMPSSDVKIEVKYKGGEYVPIPDTFMSNSLKVSFIGLILVGLGFYTINYVKRDEKVD